MLLNLQQRKELEGKLEAETSLREEDDKRLQTLTEVRFYCIKYTLYYPNNS